MLNRLAVVASEPMATSKNIITLVAARVPTQSLGLVFLMLAAFSIQVIFTNTQVKISSITTIIREVPIIPSYLEPPPPTSFTKISGEESVAFKDKVVGSDHKFKNTSINFSVFDKPQTIDTPNGNLLYTKKLRVFATSYDPFCLGCSAYTATGLKAGYGVIAVDPNVIPLGTKVYVPDYGEAVAGDTGGAIKGAVIDLGFDSIADGWWSARFTDIYVLK